MVKHTIRNLICVLKCIVCMSVEDNEMDVLGLRVIKEELDILQEMEDCPCAPELFQEFKLLLQESEIINKKMGELICKMNIVLPVNEELVTLHPDKSTTLQGKAAKKFEEYQNSKATPEEIEYAKRSEEYYLSHLPEDGPVES